MKQLVKSSASAGGSDEIFDLRPIEIGGFILRDRGVGIVGRPTLEGWQRAFHFASASHDASPYWVGALLAYSETRADWQEKMSQAMSVTGLAKQRLENLAYVSRHVDETTLTLAPSFAHAEEVAALPRPEQRQWLAKAKTEGWTKRELRGRIRAAKRSTVLEGRADTMHTVEVSVQLDIEAQEPYQAEQKAWDLVKQALTTIRGAKVIAAHVRPR